MKRFSKKFLISFIALLVISFSSFAMLSFTLADEDNGATESKVVGALSASETQIDRIIDNSHNGTYKNPITGAIDKNYNVLEISSSGNHSNLETLISNGKFKDFVIDGYASDQSPTAIKMAPDTIKYSFHTVTEADATLIDAIKNADFIYVANDPTNMYKAPSADFSEDVKTALVNAATVDNKPFMIDSFQKTYNIGTSSVKTITKLISQELSNVKTKYKQKADSSVFMNLASTSYFSFPT